MKDVFDRDEDMYAFLGALIADLKQATASDLNNEADDIWSELLSAEELKSLPESVTVGSHTVNHFRANRISQDEFQKELDQSHQSLAEAGITALHFCYPSGDRSDETDRQLKHSVYKSAVSTIRGINFPGDDVYCLRRFPMTRETKPSLILFDMMREYWRSN
jgi:peptidoglycan/xylan/chitin deacetylase (PgdA/CDA1 family)